MNHLQSTGIRKYHNQWRVQYWFSSNIAIKFMQPLEFRWCSEFSSRAMKMEGSKRPIRRVHSKIEVQALKSYQITVDFSA